MHKFNTLIFVQILNKFKKYIARMNMLELILQEATQVAQEFNDVSSEQRNEIKVNTYINYTICFSNP